MSPNSAPSACSVKWQQVCSQPFTEGGSVLSRGTPHRGCIVVEKPLEVQGKKLAINFQSSAHSNFMLALHSHCFLLLCTADDWPFLWSQPWLALALSQQDSIHAMHLQYSHVILASSIKGVDRILQTPLATGPSSRIIIVFITCIFERFLEQTYCMHVPGMFCPALQTCSWPAK